jgi:hypothetical protein
MGHVSKQVLLLVEQKLHLYHYILVFCMPLIFILQLEKDTKTPYQELSGPTTTTSATYMASSSQTEKCNPSASVRNGYSN